ncbi:MAG: hypothetical protein HC896_13875 [Bacteroidales bacterium]|nr:hypothetical protein [Bacteroidales bacterium]
MPQNNNHIIAKQTIELVLPAQENGFEWHQKIGDFCRQKLNKAIAETLDRYSSGTTIISIDKLEIDIGTLSVQNLGDELVNKIVRELDEQLYKLIKLNNNRINGQLVQMTKESIPDSIFGAWLHFLEHGHLPLQAASISSSALQETVLTKLASETSAIAHLKNLVIKSPNALNRLMLQHSNTFLQLLLEAYTARQHNRLLALLKEYGVLEARLLQQAKVKTDIHGSVAALRTRFWKAALTTYLIDNGRNHGQWQYLIVNMLATMVEHTNMVKLVTEISKNKAAYPLISELPAFVANSKEETIENVARSIWGNEAPAILPASTAEKTGGPGKPLKLDADTMGAEQKNATKKEPETTPLPPNNHAEFTNGPGMEKDIEKKKGNNWQDIRLRAADRKAEEQQNDMGTPDQVKNDARDSIDQHKSEMVNEGDAFYIQHAGVVLLNPFVNTFFGKLKLLQGKAFVNARAQEKAIHLLHYLASGQTQWPEHHMLLPKILCGLHVEEPIERFIELSDEETSEADNLLLAAIKHWGALGSASADALREGFLQRDGKW